MAVPLEVAAELVGTVEAVDDLESETLNVCVERVTDRTVWEY